jgi:hypothetical protein
MRNTPPDFSAVHYALIGGNVPQFCVTHSVAGKAMLTDPTTDALILGTEACGFGALVEFHAPPHAAVQGLHDPRNWELGLMQAMLAGSAIVYEYGSDRGLVVRAAIGPEHLPCRDTDGIDVFLDHSAVGHQSFGVPDQGQLGRPDIIDPFLDSPNVKYVYADDGPGTGAQLRLPCKQTGDKRARLNSVYHLGWTDPLDPTCDVNTARLRSVQGRLAFKTWLAMRYTPTGALFYLYEWEWAARFGLRVVGPAPSPPGAPGAELVREGAVHANVTEPIVAGPVANQSVCVKFLPVP